MFAKVLIANRGEIAVRIIRACRDLGVATVAVFSDVDRAALHVRLADEAYPVGPAPARESYLRVDRVLEVARRACAQAVHPGYGFLAESATFARACADEGLTFVGPPPEVLALTGDKLAARRLAVSLDVPVVPGTDTPLGADADSAAALSAAAQIGYPVLVKAAAGGGGKGMRVVRDEDTLLAALAQARSEAASSFGAGGVYLERYLEAPRHVEVQVLADSRGRIRHLGERECSIQRRFQKLVEECPAPRLSSERRDRLHGAAVRLMQGAGYVGAGTVEFLLDGEDRFYFLEINARLQVEHPVTELVWGVDLVKDQLRLAAGHQAAAFQSGGPPQGWAIDCRMYAEDPYEQFFPSTGTIEVLREPSGPGVRVDSACHRGQAVTADYDPLLAKLSVWGRDRPEAVARLARALDEYRIGGVRTTLEFHRFVARDRAFRAGRVNTNFVADRWDQAAAAARKGHIDAQVLAAAAVVLNRREQPPSADVSTDGPDTIRSRWRDAARWDALRR